MLEAVWFDIQTNPRGKVLEEYLTSSNLHVINIDNGVPTFESSRGNSRVDLTVTNNTILRKVGEWQSGEQESCSDHKIITFKIQDPSVGTKQRDIHVRTRYIVKEENLKKFDNALKTNLALVDWRKKYVEN